MGVSQTVRESLERQFKSEPATLAKAACYLHKKVIHQFEYESIIRYSQIMLTRKEKLKTQQALPLARMASRRDSL